MVLEILLRFLQGSLDLVMIAGFLEFEVLNVFVDHEVSVGRQELLLKELVVLRKLSSCYDAVVKNSLKAWIGNVEVVLTVRYTT